MRALAGFIMRGRMQATLVVVGCAALPLLFWMSAAAGCLVLLRRGFSDALGIVAWAALPALVWWYFGEPRTFMVLLGSLGLAAVLRATESWPRVVLASVAAGLIYAVILGSVFSELIEVMAGELQKLLPHVLGDFYRQLSAEEQARLAGLVAPVLNGLIASLLQIATVLCVILARYWQASLYNPGGFGREFRALRLPRAAMLVLLVLMIVGPNFGPQMAMLTPLCSVPLLFAGLAALHGLVAKQGLSRFWLVGAYVTLLMFMQLIYPLLVLFAVVDSLIDFRGRLASKDAGNGPASGEG